MAAPHPVLLPLIRGDEIPPGTKITPEIVASAEEHRVAALADHQAARRGIDIGTDLRTRLAMSALAVVAENQAAENTASGVLAIADDLGIEVAIFKGIATGRQFYASPSLRPTIDVDVFVNPAQAGRIGEFFAALGGSDTDRRAIDAMVVEGRVFEHSIPFVGTDVDLHRDPINMVLPTIGEQDLWDTTIEIELANRVRTRTLDLEWSILQALLHAFRDNFADLLHVFDLDLMFDTDPDWDRIAAIAAAEGWTDITRFATAFVCDVLARPTPLPRRVTRSSLMFIRRVWRDDLLLRGEDSVVASMRRQTALSILTSGRRRELVSAYTRRIAPPRSVIELRSELSDDAYPVALYRWRKNQRRANIDMKRSDSAMARRVDDETQARHDIDDLTTQLTDAGLVKQ